MKYESTLVCDAINTPAHILHVVPGVTFDYPMDDVDFKQYKMPPKSRTDTLKIIDDGWNLKGWGANYNVVTIYGPPGLGKSTLANALFGTEFPVLSSGGRQPTTEGAWISSIPRMNLLVVDAEIVATSDSGKGQTCRLRNAIFGAAISSVIIVNMTEDAFKRTSAIKEVVEEMLAAHLCLFEKRTMFLFALRDCPAGLSHERLASRLKTHMRSVWPHIKKPFHLRTCSVDDAFDYDLAIFPSKLDFPKEFDAAVVELRARFSDRDREDHVIKPHYWKLVAAEDLSGHLVKLWLDIATHWSVLRHSCFAVGSEPETQEKKSYDEARAVCLFHGEYAQHVGGLYDVAINSSHTEFVKMSTRLMQSNTVSNGRKIIAAMKEYYANVLDMFNSIVRDHEYEQGDAKRQELREMCSATVHSLYGNELPWDVSDIDMQPRDESKDESDAKGDEKSQSSYRGHDGNASDSDSDKDSGDDSDEDPMQRLRKLMALLGNNSGDDKKAKSKSKERNGEISKQKREIAKLEAEIEAQTALLCAQHSRAKEQERAGGRKTRDSRQDAATIRLQARAAVQETLNGERKDRISEQHAELCELRTQASKQDTEIGEQRARIAYQAEEINRLTTKCAAKKAKNNEQKSKIAEQSAEIGRQNAKIYEQSVEISSQKARIDAQSTSICSLKAQAVQQVAKLADQQLIIERRNKSISKQKDTINMLHATCRVQNGAAGSTSPGGNAIQRVISLDSTGSSGH
ncbi:root hair defective 3 GTP-binding protein-domain-containing protein [Thamnocephalis sphaerospora]|uniref:Root hair defective 3 GTP-binding protein-domain-containing protein n=1 Tax=Thamnocephalis sphaerospora TaxID=78915 RepID=A0A4P9XSG1_9FUNG|nr:root hair defective 3 GTP-binding protein-domain-containing protein [Thamnocephalis sphaerospora]|eukprot:RKP09046.1 root hair defective 3 GTP-binding protein-domain-containing protein [Thamnocephalis sphaerospora]